MSIYLVWSNEHHAYWGPNKSGYTTSWLEAGRYTREEAAECCSRRTWEPRRPPPEVMVVAPDSERDAFTMAELCAIPQQLQDRIRKATRTAIRERRAQKAAAS